MALQDCCDLGQGFRLAERDMAIRGIGSLFGEQQSGDAAKIGTDLYFEMLMDGLSKVLKIVIILYHGQLSSWFHFVVLLFIFVYWESIGPHPDTDLVMQVESQRLPPVQYEDVQVVPLFQLVSFIWQQSVLF